MTNIIYIATSLDGYIARKDGGLDWLTEIPNPDNNDYGYSELILRIDGIIMGRKTFETVVGFEQWPYSKPVFVLSNTLQQVPSGYEKRAKIVSGNLKDILGRLEKDGFTVLYIDGGQTIQNFLKQDLIDEMIITKVPVLLGKGIILFNEMNRELAFEHIETVVYNNMLVKSHYKRDRF